jgi:hypothetical protein
MTLMGRLAVTGVVVLGTAAVACAHSTDATGFIFQYGISAFGCDTTCAAPGADTITTAGRGDTVWLRHEVLLVNAVGDSADATMRPTCTVNVVIQAGVNPVRTAPAPTTCAEDSTAAVRFAIGGVAIRYTQWVVDSGLTPMTYVVVGRIMVRPLIEPSFQFTITP